MSGYKFHQSSVTCTQYRKPNNGQHVRKPFMVKFHLFVSDMPLMCISNMFKYSFIHKTSYCNKRNFSLIVFIGFLTTHFRVHSLIFLFQSSSGIYSNIHSMYSSPLILFRCLYPSHYLQ